MNISSRGFFSFSMIDKFNLVIFGGKEIGTNKILSDYYSLNINDFHWS